MMNEDNHNKKITAVEIERYLKRELSEGEMHAMEKAALEDPFLADALEGYAAGNTPAQESTFKPDLNELKTRLQHRISKERIAASIIRGNWWKIAATIIIIAGTGSIIYNSMNNTSESRDQLAKNESAIHSTADSSLMNRSESDTLNLNNANAPSQHSIASLDNTKTSITSPRRIKTDSIYPAGGKEQIFAGKVEGKTEPMADRIEEIAVPLSIDPAVLRSNRTNNQESSANASVAAPSLSNIFSGRVVDRLNNPVAGASVIVVNSNVGVHTDKDGNFNVAMPDTIINVKVASVGFEPANLTLRNSLTDNRIMLQAADGNLDEVVVVGYGTQRKQSVSKNVKDMVIEPEGGWAAYSAYLKKNRRVNVGDTILHGNVVISFSVNKKGKPTDLKIEQSLSSSLDAEAKRLVMAGPGWKPVKDKARSNLIISF